MSTPLSSEPAIRPKLITVPALPRLTPCAPLIEAVASPSAPLLTAPP